jgi:hypothetical protein
MAKEFFCVKGCPHLVEESPNHDVPLHSMLPHECNLYNKMVFHGPYWPKLIRYPKCTYRENIETISL